MTRRSRVWLILALLFTVVNLLGGGYAAALGEPLHAAIHFVLTLLGALVMRRIVSGSWGFGAREGAAETSAASHELTDRLTALEQSIDSVAIEVERIGEGQRYVTRVLSGNDATEGGGQRVGEPAERQPPEPERIRRS